jgi:precorrin-4 methylase
MANKLEVPTEIPYTDCIKNKNMNTNLLNRVRAQEINQMCEDDKSMHIFYTLEEIEDVVKSLHKVLRSDDPFIGHKITKLENIVGELVGIQDRAETFIKKKGMVTA